MTIKTYDIKNPYHPQSHIFHALNSLICLYTSHYPKDTIITVAKDYDRNLGSNLIADVEGWYK